MELVGRLPAHRSVAKALHPLGVLGSGGDVVDQPGACVDKVERTIVGWKEIENQRAAYALQGVNVGQRGRLAGKRGVAGAVLGNACVKGTGERESGP